MLALYAWHKSVCALLLARMSGRVCMCLCDGQGFQSKLILSFLALLTPPPPAPNTQVEGAVTGIKESVPAPPTTLEGKYTIPPPYFEVARSRGDVQIHRGGGSYRFFPGILTSFGGGGVLG